MVKEHFIITEIANRYLALSPESFEEWLQETAAKYPNSTYELVLSAYLAETIDFEQWARDHATPAPLTPGQAGPRFAGHSPAERGRSRGCQPQGD